MTQNITEALPPRSHLVSACAKEEISLWLCKFYKGQFIISLVFAAHMNKFVKRVCLSSSRDHVATDIKIRLRTAKCENTRRIFLRLRPVACPANVNIALIVQMAPRVPNHAVCTKNSAKNVCLVDSKYYHCSITLHFYKNMQIVSSSIKKLYLRTGTKKKQYIHIKSHDGAKLVQEKKIHLFFGGKIL